MSKVCSSHNLSVLEEILNEFRLRCYVLKVITDMDYDKIKENENEWFGVLFDVVDLLHQSKSDLDTFECCLRKETNMNAD